MVVRGIVLFSALLASAFSAFSQQGSLRCRTSAVPPTVRLEGLTEQFGDISLDCTGGVPNSIFAGNLTAFLNTNITNKLLPNNYVDVGLLYLNAVGSYENTNVPALLVTNSTISFTGVSVPLNATGGLSLRITNLRGVANQGGVGNPLPIVALLSSNTLLIDNPQVYIASPQPGLAATILPTIIGCNSGAGLPTTLNLANLYNSGAYYSSARVTEVFGDAFQKKTTTADTGTRILVRYTDLPASTQLYVPDVVTGSDALEPSRTGMFGGTPSGGQYQQASRGTLLLVRVVNADINGFGGTLAFTPGTTGVATFNNVSPVTVGNGLATATYEVVDSNPSILESAEIPTFIGIPPNPNATQPTYQIGGGLALGPVSAAVTASTLPIPRFAIQQNPGPDCGLIGDCNAGYYPKLFVDSPQLAFDLVERAGFERRNIRVLNQNNGPLFYAASVKYLDSGTNWVKIFPQAGTTPSTLFLDAITTSLRPGTYRATLTIDGGIAGKVDLPISVTVRAAPAGFPGSVSSVGGAATFSGPLVPGSLATIIGTRLGNGVQVTFDGQPATVLFSNDTQINLLVPASLAGKSTAQLVLTAGGLSSQPVTVNLSRNAPGIFANGVANQNNSANSSSNPATPGSVLQVYLTGVSFPDAQVLVKLKDQTVTPLYAGPAPGIDGVQQVNVQIPSDLTGSSADLQVCVTQFLVSPVCSPAVAVSLRQ